MTVMIRLALRLGRWGMVGFAAIAFILVVLNGVGFYQIAGDSAESRQKFGESMSVLATQFSIIVPPPIRPDTVGGYVQFRGFGALTILFAVWALASAAGASRGDEERGIVESIVGAGLSRAKTITARATAFAIAGALAALAGSVGMLASVAFGHETFSAVKAIEAATVIAALAFACYALTLAVAQFTGARNTTAVAGSLLLGLFLLNSLSRTFDQLKGWRLLSPFYYSDLSRPLPPGGTFDVRATLTLVAIGVACTALAAIAFSLRDLGSPLLRLPAPSHPASYDPDPAPAWRIEIVRDLYERRFGLLAWAAGLSAIGAIFVILTKTIVEPLMAIPQLRPYLDAFLHGAVYPSFLGFIWFSFAQLLMAGFAIAQVARWSAEDTDGRLELVLSNPVSRARVVIDRALVLAVGALLIAGVSGVAVGAEARYQSINLDPGHLAAATLLLVPFTLVFAAIGALGAARLPRATVGLLGAFAIASYFLLQLGPIFKMPEWVQDLSAFKLYGQPLTQGVDQTGLAIMIAIVAVGFTASALMMQRRNVGA